MRRGSMRWIPAVVLLSAIAAIAGVVLVSGGRDEAGASDKTPPSDVAVDLGTPGAVSEGDPKAETRERITEGVGIQAVPELASALGEIAGSVYSEASGINVAGATIFVYRGSELAGSATSDAKKLGEYSVADLKPGSYRVEAAFEGLAPRVVDPVEVQAGVRSIVDFSLDIGATLRFEANDGTTGVPVAGVAIEVVPGERSPRLEDPDYVSRTALRGVTDASGLAEIGALPQGTLQVVARAAGYAAWTEEVVLSTEYVVVPAKLVSGATIRGSIFDSSGRPKEGALVFVAPRDVDSSAWRQAMYAEDGVPVDSTGHYVIRSVPPGIHGLAAVTEQGEAVVHSEPIVIEASEEVIVDLTIAAPSMLAGRVIAGAGKPVPKAAVRILTRDFLRTGWFRFDIRPKVSAVLDRDYFTAEDGTFEIPIIRNGTGELKVRANAAGFSEGSASVSTEPGERTFVDISVIQLSGAIAGRVSGLAGEGMGGTRLLALESLNGKFTGGSYAATADSNGSYSIAVPDHGGVFSVRPSIKGSKVISEPKAYEGLRAGAVGVDFCLRPEFAFRGLVVDASDDLPITEFSVTLYDDHAFVFERPIPIHSEEGRFDVGIEPARHTHLIVTAIGYVPATIYAPESLGPEDVATVHLPRGSTLNLKIVDHRNRPLDAAAVCIATLDGELLPPNCPQTPRGVTNADGQVTLEGVPLLSRGTILVAPHRIEETPLAHFALADISTKETEQVLMLPKAEPARIRITGRGAENGGRVLPMDSDKWVLDPSFESALLRTGAGSGGPGPELVDGGRKLFLPEGDYVILFVPKPGSSANARHEFKLSVKAGERNQYEFQVP